jgi:hypothetical protein
MIQNPARQAFRLALKTVQRYSEGIQNPAEPFKKSIEQVIQPNSISIKNHSRGAQSHSEAFKPMRNYSTYM